VGSYFENAEYESSFSEATDRDTFGLYLNHSWQVVDAFLLNGTLGWDDHDDFGDEFTWNAGALYEVTESTVLKANAGTAFRAPNFGELFGSFGGNPDLDPESSFNWDLGVEQSFGETTASLTWFENDVEDLIAYDFTAGYLNTEGKSKANGIEFAVDSQIESINSSVFVSYTYYQNTLDAIIPEQTASAGIETVITSEINVGLIATWVDQRTSSDPVVDTLDSYFLLDLYGNYQVSENLKLHARIENLFDEDYLLGDFSGSFGDLNSVQGRGRGIYGGATLTF
jgi:vitamin B12 transporter